MLAFSPGAPSPGARQVLVPGSSVTPVGVEVRETHRYGIYQRGGDIELRAVTVGDIRREAGQTEYGTGLLLQDGVQAMLSSVTLNDDESSGIILRGRDSHVEGTDVTLRRNKMHPDFHSIDLGIFRFPARLRGFRIGLVGLPPF
jgi:hypothetical protein